MSRKNFNCILFSYDYHRIRRISRYRTYCMFYYKRALYGITTLLFLIMTHATPNTKLDLKIKNNLLLEEKITRQAIRFKKEMKFFKTAFFGLCAIAVLSNGYQIFQFARSFFEPNQPIHQSLFFSAIKGIFHLSYSAVVTYIIQKGIQYGISYYFHNHPIFWLLSRRVHIQDHFDSLLCKIANEQKKSPLCRSAHSNVKNYLLLFTKIIFKDSQKICAFMRYRAFLLPSYKQPTALLIQQNILLFVQEWVWHMETCIEQELSSFDDLYQETLQFKKQFFEQINLFVKIDDEKEFLHNIITILQSPVQ